MSQEPEQQSATSDTVSAPRPRKVRKILLLAMVIILLTVGGGLAYLMFTDDPYPG